MDLSRRQSNAVIAFTVREALKPPFQYAVQAPRRPSVKPAHRAYVERRPDAQKQVMRYLIEHDEEVSIQELMDELDICYSTAKGATRRLAKSGMLSVQYRMRPRPDGHGNVRCAFFRRVK